MATSNNAAAASAKNTGDEPVVGVKVEPLKTGEVTLLTGIFKIPSKRTLTLWPNYVQLSIPNKKSRVIAVRMEHAHVQYSSGSKKFTVTDRSRDQEFAFSMPTVEEAAAWAKHARQAIQNRLKARQAALLAEKAKMDAIAARLGVHTIGVSQEKKAPVLPPPDVEPKKLTIAAVTEQDESGKESVESGKGELSQEVINAARATGNTAILENGLAYDTSNDLGSGDGRVTLEGDVYWYELNSTDTLAGVCLRFDTHESKVRSANFISKRGIDGKKVLRIPRRITGDPSHDYTQTNRTVRSAVHKVEDPEVKRQRQQKFKVHIMCLLSAQRALKEEDCFTANEALAYLNLHDHDLNKALEAMEQDQHWYENYGHLLEARRRRLQQQRAEGATLSQAVVDGMVPEAAPGSADSTVIELQQIGTSIAVQ